MALLHTPLCDSSLHCIDFTLPDLNGNPVSLSTLKGENGTMIAFICNHCPYVKALAADLASSFAVLKKNSIGVCAIMPNDAVNYPQDSPEKMTLFAQAHGFDFPYLYDETQETAKAYGAVCTPDFFGFNRDGVLQYRGRLTDPQKPEPAAANELVQAMLMIAKTGVGPAEQLPSMGCSIKWRH